MNELEPDAQQQLQPVAYLAQNLASGVRAAPCGLLRAQKRMQLVEMQIANVKDALACNGEKQTRGPQPRALTIGASALHHHLF